MDKIKRNKKKILIATVVTAAVIGGGYFAYKFLVIRPETLEAAQDATEALAELAKSGK